ncbi:unnamed protein product [Adineta steineri]|nr:unnamed protein product [Adineta steineri]
MNTISDDELLFYGSVETNFAYHYGTVNLSHNNPIDECTLNSKILSPIETEDHQLILPGIPANFIQIQSTTNNIRTISDEFCYPLIKTKLASPLKGIISGTRSALIKSKSSKWYRLKGCGDNTDGFLIKSLSNTKSTIRGCAFLHTTYRELIMTDYISHMLSQYKIECANISIGWFEYKLENENCNMINSDIPIIQDIHLHQWSNIVRCCILMETLDQNNEQLIPLSTWFASLTNILEPIDYQNSHWLDLSSHFSDEIPSDIDENYCKIIWKNNSNIINNALHAEQSLGDLLCLLYKRFGFECGSILGLMHYHRISWGTYTDELGIHCNAHPNNLVIKLPSSASPFFLAPLDFDMSFIEKSYQPNQMNTQSFDEIIKLELSGFQLTLAGDSQMSSGVTTWIEMPDDQWTSARWLLRDIMLNEFNSSYNETIQNGSIQSFDSFSNIQNQAMQSIIRLALIKTMKETG